MKKCMKLNWNFKRGGEVHVFEKKTLHGAGMDIFWNCTIGNLNYCKQYFRQ